MDVAGIGWPCVDELISIEKLPVTDRGARTLESSWQYGGKVPTALVALARLGYKTAIYANVGGIFGRLIRLDFERHGVDCSYLRDIPGTNSGLSLCLAEKSTGGRSFIGLRTPNGVPSITVEDLDKHTLLQANWLLISNLDETTTQAAQWFKEAGKPVVIDADHFRPESLDRLHLVDHFLASEYTYNTLTDGSDQYEKNLRTIRKYQKNDSVVTVVTLGAKGLVGLDEKGEFFEIPAYKVDVIDTTGAGDVFHGAYIAGRLEGYNAKEACRFAQAVAAVKCTKLGGRAAIPTLEQTKEFMETGRVDFPELDERAAYYRELPFDRVK